MSRELVIQPQLVDTERSEQADALKLRNRMLGIQESTLTQHVTLVLDRSISMESHIAELVRNTHRFLDDPDLASVSTELIFFNDSISRHKTIDEIYAAGSTAIYLALEQAILITAAEVAHNNVTIYFQSDGDNMCSYDHMYELEELIRSKKALGWRFVWIKYGHYGTSKVDHLFEVTQTTDLPRLMDSFKQTIVAQLTGQRLQLPEKI